MASQASTVVLQQSIEAGEAWRALYERTTAAVERENGASGRSWDLDNSSIFAQIDAFVQRCKDLQERFTRTGCEALRAFILQ